MTGNLTNRAKISVATSTHGVGDPIPFGSINPESMSLRLLPGSHLKASYRWHDENRSQGDIEISRSEVEDRILGCLALPGAQALCRAILWQCSVFLCEETG